MEREIKYQIWNKELQEMYKVNLISYLGSRGITDTNVGNSSAIWLAFTGICDKNDNEIFEGNIIKGHYLSNQKDCRIVGEVVYTGIGFKLKGINQYKGIQVEFDTSFEVIGNIYENPELLNV